MIVAPFRGPRLLIDRKHHLQALTAELPRIAGQVEVKIVEQSRTDDLVEYALHIDEVLEDSSGMALREAINALTVCLDVMLCDAAQLILGDNADLSTIAFPFAKLEKDFYNKIRRMKLGDHMTNGFGFITLG